MGLLPLLHFSQSQLATWSEDSPVNCGHIHCKYSCHSLRDFHDPIELTFLTENDLLMYFVIIWLSWCRHFTHCIKTKTSIALIKLIYRPALLTCICSIFHSLAVRWLGLGVEGVCVSCSEVGVSCRSARMQIYLLIQARFLFQSSLLQLTHFIQLQIHTVSQQKHWCIVFENKRRSHCFSTMSSHYQQHHFHFCCLNLTTCRTLNENLSLSTIHPDHLPFNLCAVGYVLYLSTSASPEHNPGRNYDSFKAN